MTWRDGLCETIQDSVQPRSLINPKSNPLKGTCLIIYPLKRLPRAQLERAHVQIPRLVDVKSFQDPCLLFVTLLLDFCAEGQQVGGHDIHSGTEPFQTNQEM
jgi:hypothetical protein